MTFDDALAGVLALVGGRVEVHVMDAGAASGRNLRRQAAGRVLDDRRRAQRLSEGRHIWETEPNGAKGGDGEYRAWMPLPDDYWSSYEGHVATLGGFMESVRMVSAYQARTGTRFVWKGAADADWAMHSSLVRAYLEREADVPMEPELRAFEAEVIGEARDWGLDWHGTGGRLAALELLAALQHYGVPTRILDFSLDPMIGLWFAVEALDDRDGRVFAIDISNRTIARDDAARPDPWWWELPAGTTTEWATESWAWQPPPLEPRMVRQKGCFLMGGVPSTQPSRSRRTAGGWEQLHASEVRECMSVPFRLIGYDQAVAAYEGRNLPGATPKARAFTLRVQEKANLRQELEQAFSHSYRSLFPDFPGFAAYGSSFR